MSRTTLTISEALKGRFEKARGNAMTYYKRNLSIPDFLEILLENYEKTVKTYEK